MGDWFLIYLFFEESTKLKILSEIKPTFIVNKKNKANITILISIVFFEECTKLKILSEIKPTLVVNKKNKADRNSSISAWVKKCLY